MASTSRRIERDHAVVRVQPDALIRHPQVARWQRGTIANCFVHAALGQVHTRGLDSDALLAKAGLSSPLLVSPQGRVSARQYGELWRQVALALDDEFLGQDSRRMKPGSFAMICHAVLHCESLGKALERILRFFGLLLDDISGCLLAQGGKAGISLTTRIEPPNVFAHELLLVLIHGLACWLVRRRIEISHAQFRYLEPARSAEYRVMFSQHLSYGAPSTVIVFDADYLNLPLAQTQRSLKEFLRVAPEGMLVKYKDIHSLSARVRRRLRRCFPEGPLMECRDLASAMGMTEVTLRRRLQGEGTSYQEIKDRLRLDLAIEYLCRSDRSTTDIGFELGFSERSAFHRAFKKWTGSAPGHVRRHFAG